MIGQMIRRLGSNWRSYLALAGGFLLWVLLVLSGGVSLYLLLSFVLTWLAGATGTAGGGLFLALWVAGGLLLLGVAGGLSQAGMVGSLLEWRQGKAVSVPRYFDWSIRFGGRFLGLWARNGLYIGGGGALLAGLTALVAGAPGAKLLLFLQIQLLLSPALLAILWAQGVTGGVLLIQTGEAPRAVFRRQWATLGANIGPALYTLTIDLSLYLLLVLPVLVLLLPGGLLLAVPLFAYLLVGVTDGLVERFDQVLAPYFPAR